MTRSSRRVPLTPALLLEATPRAAYVARVLHSHGFGGLLRGEARWPAPARVRAALEELGPVFVKFGQILSTRADLLPEAYLEALADLQDRVTPVSFADIRRVFEEDMGEGPEDAFLHFDPQPLASASMAQVHAAETRDGRSVVVKVQRPELGVMIERDLAVLAQVAAALDLTVRGLQPLDLPALVADFRRTLLEEADFRREAASVRRFRTTLGSEPAVWIPPVLDRWSGRRVLTMERSRGHRLERYVGEHPDEAAPLAQRLGELFIRQVFRDGLFHADPHPGNFFVLSDGRVCLHDFGMVGELDDGVREALVALVRATVAGDARGATRAYLDMGLLPPDVDGHVLREEVGRLVRDIRARPLKEVSVGEALRELVRIGGSHRIRQPGTFLLLSRAFVTLEGLMTRLDPDLAFLDVFSGAYRATVQRRVSTDRLAKDAVSAASELDRLVREGPGELRRIMEKLADGELGRVTAERGPATRRAQAEEDRALRRVVAGGALVIAGAVLLTVVGTPWSTASGVGLLLGGLLSLALGLPGSSG